MFPLLLASFNALAATALVYLGISFINGQLVPSLLEGAYDRLTVFWRSILVLLLFATPANLLISTVYRLVDPGTSGVILIAALAIVLTAKTILLGADGLGWRTAAAALAVTLCMCWLAWELHRASA